MRVILSDLKKKILDLHLDLGQGFFCISLIELF